jgi:hypothetical protein
LAAAQTLAPLCKRGDILWAPPDISLYSMAWSACSPHVAHEAVADYPQRLSALHFFYGTADPTTRRSLLDRACVTHLMLPGDSSALGAFLGAGTQFRKASSVGRGGTHITVYQRPGPSGCALLPGVAAGVDGIFREVHENPARALSDGPNACTLRRLQAILSRVLSIHAAANGADVRERT